MSDRDVVLAGESGARIFGTPIRWGARRGARGGGAPTGGMMTDEGRMHEAIDDLVDAWHDGHPEGRGLREHLGMEGVTDQQWSDFVSRAIIPPGYALPEATKGGER